MGGDFATRYGPWALVAGASDGIGEAFAREIAARGGNVVLVARREAVLEDVAASLRADHGVETRVVVADLTSPELEATITTGIAGLDVGLLVYNAGAEHAVGHFLDRPVRDARFLVDLNCHGVVTLTHLLGRSMRDRGRGGIVLMTSMAAMAGAGHIATYAATKSFELLFAEALWQELQPLGVDVTAVLAGATDTPSMRASNEAFADRAADLAQPHDVAVEALDWLGRGPVVAPGDTNKAILGMLRPGTRVDLSNGMTQATAELYDLPFVAAAGEG
jgi:uncharacterized protein